jgi:hypothetical protein
MEALMAAVTVLTAMIAPAVLISACSGLILSTSHRLWRVTDRVRVLSDKLEEISHGETKIAHRKELCRAIFVQLTKLTHRARILQRAIVVFYTTLGIFVATSIAIGIVAATGAQYAFLPVVFGLSGACLLFYGSVSLIYESRLSLITINTEMNLVWHLAKHHAPEEFEEYSVSMARR